MAAETQIRDSGTIGLAAWTGQSRGMAAAHRHLDLEINYVLRGPMRYLIGGQIVALPPERLCLLWGGVPHQMMVSREAAEAIWVTIPLASVLRWGLPDRLIRPLLATGFIADPSPRSGDLELLQQWMADLPDLQGHPSSHCYSDDIPNIALLEIEARLRRLAVGLGSGSASARALPETSAVHSDRGLTAVEAMAHCITRRFHDNIGVAEIAAAAHLHPNYAMTLFRRHTGMTLSQYLTLQRVAHAQRLLAGTDDAIASIALQSGFGSVSRFYEAFRHQTGNSPRRFRLHVAPE